MRARAALAALALVAVAAWALVPTYPDYDAYYHLLWGRELLHGITPDYQAPFASTPHPLYIAFCALLSLTGEHADRLLVLCILLSLVALIGGAYALGRALFGAAPAAAGAFFVGSSFAFLLYAVRAFVDVPFLALVFWAAALAVRSERRGLAPLALLAVAGLLRPDAWALAGLYWLWCLPGASMRTRAGWLVLVLAAPVAWGLVDLAVTGNPLFSLTNTHALAQTLQRERGLGHVPSTFVAALADLARPPVALAGVAGLLLGLRRLGAQRMAVPLALAGTGALAFVAIGVAGLSLIPRYLTVPAVALCVLAGYAMLGFTTLEQGRERTRWRAGAICALVVGLAFLAVKLPSFGALRSELRFIDRTHEDVSALLDDPYVRGGMRCGPLTLPTYRLVPDARWLLNAGAGAIQTRASASGGVRPPGAVAVYIAGDAKFERRFGRADGVSRATNRLPRGRASLVDGPFTAYVMCPARPR